MAEDSRTNQLSGSSARRPSPSSPREAAGSGALCGAGEEGQEEENHRDSKEYPQYGGVELVIWRVCDALLSRERGGGAKKLSPPVGGRRRRRPPQRGRPRGRGKGRPLRRTIPTTPKRMERSGRTEPSIRRYRKYLHTRVTHDIF